MTAQRLPDQQGHRPPYPSAPTTCPPVITSTRTDDILFCDPRVCPLRSSVDVRAARGSARHGVEGAAECPAGDAQLGGDGGSGLSGAEQDAGVGDLIGG
jgi:hypothetical protein